MGVFQNVVKPAKMEWQSGQEALEDALSLERLVNQSLLDLHKVAEEVNDPHLQDFIEGEFLTEQVESIKEIGDLITQAKRCGKVLENTNLTSSPCRRKTELCTDG